MFPEKIIQTQRQLVIGNNKPMAVCSDVEIANLFKYIFVLIGLNKNNLPDEFAKEILIEFVRDELKTITIQEIMLAFELAVKNKIDVNLNTYGGDFSPKLLMEVFTAYKEYKATKHKPEVHPNIYTQTTGLFNILKKQAPETLEYLNEIGTDKKEPPKPREKTQEEILMNDLMREFDDLHYNEAVNSGGQRFVKYANKILSMDEYLLLRIKELSQEGK